MHRAWRAAAHACRRALIACLMVPVLAASARQADTPLPAGQLDPQQMGWVAPEIFDGSSGLEQTTVTAIAVMPDRSVWIGTMRGLYRQVGSRMQAITAPGVDLQQQIMAIQPMPDGSVWVATARDGLYLAKPDGRWIHDTPMGDSHAREILRIKRVRPRGAGSDQLWAMGDGLYVHGTRGWEPSPLQQRLPGSRIRDAAIDPADGSVWIATFGNGLLHCIGDAVCREERLPAGPRAKEAYNVLLEPAADGSIDVWATFFGGGLARRHAGTWTRWHTGNSDIGSNYGSVLLATTQGRERAIWAGTRQGARVFRAGRWEPIALPDPLLQRRVNALTPSSDADGIGQVWIGTEGGALRLPLQSTWRIVRPLAATSNGIMSVLIDRGPAGAEDLWVVVDGQGVARYRQGQWRSFDQTSGLPRNEVRNIVRMPAGDADAGLWIGDYYGNVSRIVDDRVQVIPTPWPKRDDVVARMMLADPQSGIWVSITGLGMARYRHGRWDWMPPGSAPGVPLFAYAGVKVDDSLWFATREGELARYRGGQWRMFKRDIGLTAQINYSIALLPDATGRKLVWMGNERGVQHVDVSDPDNPRLVDAGRMDALALVETYDIQRDGRGDVLLCTQYGIQRLREQPGQPPQVLTYHVRDGLPHDECNATAMARDAAGRIWLGTVGGLAVYDPQAANRTSARVAVRLTGLDVDGRHQPLPANGTQLQLQAGQALRIGYHLPTGSQERLLRYRVHLKGLEPAPVQWDEATSHSWPALPSGTYTLLVEAVLPQGQTAEPYQLHIDVLAPWWRRWPALLAYTLLTLAGIGLWQRWRERALQQRNLQLEATVEERTAALQARSDELKRSNAELLHLSYHDALTGLHNRRYMMEQLEAQWALHAQRRQSLALILIDVDHFKRINDTLGHDTGDQCLIAVADCLRKHVPEDMAFRGRHGGEEFLVLVPQADEARASVLAETLRQAFAAFMQPPMTASFGVAAAVPDGELRADSLLIRADHALYAAKNAGRNRVTVASQLED